MLAAAHAEVASTALRAAGHAAAAHAAGRALEEAQTQRRALVRRQICLGDTCPIPMLHREPATKDLYEATPAVCLKHTYRIEV